MSIGRAKVLKEFQKKAAQKFHVNSLGDILGQLRNVMSQADMVSPCANIVTIVEPKEEEKKIQGNNLNHFVSEWISDYCE